MKIKKMLLREETEKVLHTKSNGDKLVANSSGQGYSAYTRDDVHIGHIEAETDASAIAEFSKKEPQYESTNKEDKKLHESSFNEVTGFFNWIQEYRDGALYDDFSAEFESVDDADLDMDSILTWLESFDEEAYYDYIDKNESLNEDYFDTVEYRVQRYEDDIQDLFQRVHEGYKNGMVNAKAYADALAKIYSVLEELDYVNEGLVPDKIGGDVNINLDGSHSSVGFLGGTATNTNNGDEGDHDAANSHNEDLDEADDRVDDDFMDAENIEMKDLDSPVGKEEDIEFVMSEYIPDSLLIEFVKKVEKNKYLVGVEDEVVTVEFDPNWSEYVYTIEGKGPYSHSSYEYIARDVHDFVMANRTHTDEYDDDYNDLSAFNECGEVKTADALYGVGREDTLTEARYRDSNGIMGAVGATYSEADLKKAWEDGKDNDPSMSAYNGDYDAWLKDTISNMSKNEAFDMRSGIDLNKLSWQVASYLDVDKLGEDKWIEFSCDDPRDLMGSRERTMRFEAIGEDSHKYGFIKTAGSRVEVKFRNGSEAMCNSAEEVARFVAGEFGVTI